MAALGEQELRLQKPEAYLLTLEVLLGVSVTALVLVRALRKIVETPFDYAIGFFVAWLLLYPLFSVLGRKQGRTQRPLRYAFGGVIGSLAGLAVALLLR